ncbi:PREDICTED: uncharacterized protein LOC109165196 [Ipomoea nil]|uniref:uncharacterized protein LOC109165196 n=1 Tax=Ipomoea nil TaxID=35883 RepID=UPI000900F711|nr:PREDICTED: uncharacterized protein LOC109165196 [Ipomoea nil]
MYGHPSRGGGRKPFSRGGGGRKPLSRGANFNSNPNLYYSESPNVFPDPFQNPYLQYQNPFPNPNFQFQAQRSRPAAVVERIDKAVLEAHREILATGEVVSAWKVSQAALVILQADTWDSLGFQMQQVPYLHRLMLAEGKINDFIHCFVGARRITTLHDLEIAICNTEGVERFEDLELGPLVKHPLIIHYFSLSANSTEVCRITSEEIVSLLSEFMDIDKQRYVEIEELLDFIAKKKSVTAKEKLGVRIQSLGMHITLIRQAWQSEITTVAEEITRLGCSSSKQSKRKRKYINVQTPVTSLQKVHKTQRIQTPFRRREQTKFFGKKSKQSKGTRKYSNIQILVTSLQKVRNTKKIQTPFNRKEQTKISGEKNKRLVKQEYLFHSSYSSDSMKMFITTWKETCQANNVDEVFEKMIQVYRNRKRATARKLFSAYPLVDLLHIAVTSIKNGMWDSMCDTFQSFSQLDVANTVSENCSDFVSNHVESPRRKASSLSQKLLAPEHDSGELVSDIAIANITPGMNMSVDFCHVVSTSEDTVSASNLSNLRDGGQLSLSPANAQQALLTGRLGELVAFKYFVGKVGNAFVKWVNETFETGLPYDLVVGDQEYIEVKATKIVRKNWFKLSAREWQFAVEKGELYSIAHVMLSATDTATVTVYKNPAKLIQLGKLQLDITISFSN